MLIIHKRKQVRLGGLTIPLSSSIALLLARIVDTVNIVGVIGAVSISGIISTIGVISICVASILCVNPNHPTSNRAYAEERENSEDYNAHINRASSGFNPTIAMSIAGDLSQTTNSNYDQTNYRTHNVKITGQDIASYSLYISSTSTTQSNLVHDTENNFVIKPANGETGENLANNTWGYAMSNLNEDIRSVSYHGLPSYSSPATLLSDSTTETNIDITKQLTFAVRFSNDAPSGHYRTNVLLSLASEPKSVTGFANIIAMQDMTADVCKSVAIGTTGELYDTRDKEIYSVRKHEDGNCWMTSNLRLNTKGLIANAHSTTLTASDTDIAEGSYVLPDSDINGFDTSDYYVSQMYYAGNPINGAYYSWTAATAGSGDANLTKGDAPSSICPKGWKLPPNSGNGSYANFTEKTGITDNAAGSEKIRATPYEFVYAGYVYDSELVNINLVGTYWSNTSMSEQIADLLYLTNSELLPSAQFALRPVGQSIRCVTTTPEEHAYQISYKLKNGYMLNDTHPVMPEDQTVTTADTSYTFNVGGVDTTIVSGGPINGQCNIKNWLGSDGNIYTPGSTITLDLSMPAITLTTNETKNCKPGAA